jgi:hypothetical protein
MAELIHGLFISVVNVNCLVVGVSRESMVWGGSTMDASMEGGITGAHNDWGGGVVPYLNTATGEV